MNIPMKNAHTQTIAQCLKMLASGEGGLSLSEAQNRLAFYGENRLPEIKSSPIWLVFLSQFMNPLIYILIFAGIVTVFMGEYAGAIFIFAVLLVNALIGAAQEYSANREAGALKKLAASYARVRRAGVIEEIDASQLVPGDIVLLVSGDKTPADLRLIQAAALKIDESLLTGESRDVLKRADITLEEDIATGDRINMAFAGTMVSHGRGVGAVVATGLHTKVGEIARSVTQKSKAKSPLIIRMERFTLQISLLIGVLIVIISGILYAQGNDLKIIFLLAVGLSVAAIPEGLPVTLTIALSLAMRRMAKRHVIVRKLVAVESLGSCTLIAADKTGTLTRNELTAERLVLPSGEHFIVTAGDSMVDGVITRKDAP